MKDIILIVDDQQLNLQLVSHHLSSKYQVLTAETGEEALIIAENQTPDLILMDIIMPGLNGFDVCRRLKENEKTAKVPVIFVTATSSEKDISEAFEAGGVDYITKPFKPVELHARIKTHLDLSDSKEVIKLQNEELKESLKRNDRFVSIIAHNLKSPFNGLLSISQMLIEDKDEIDAQEREALIETVFHSAQTAFVLVQDLLIWSRIQNGRMLNEPHPFSLKSVLTEVILSFQRQCTEKNITVHTDCRYLACQVHADKNNIKIVMENLISNAIKFSHPGSEINISFKELENEIEFCIKDSGVGIHPSEHGDLFSVDKDVSTFGTKNEKGSGLGLLICKALLEMNYGKLWFESNIDSGSSFYFTVNKFYSSGE